MIIDTFRLYISFFCDDFYLDWFVEKVMKHIWNVYWLLNQIEVAYSSYMIASSVQ